MKRDINIYIKILLFIIPLLLIIIISLLYNSFRSIDNSNYEISDNSIDSSELKYALQDYEISEFTYSAWIPSWGTTSGLASLRNDNGLFNSISPVWYQVNEDGSLRQDFGKYRQEIIDVLNTNDIELIPAIAMFDHELFTKVLQNQESLDRHVDSIHRAVIDNDYDGIDLDYESTKLTDKDKYFEFLDKLSGKLKADNKKLIVTVIAKWGDNITYPSLIETRSVQDWTKILDYADKIRIMAYDYTYSKNKFAGPIGPLNWIDEILKYAMSKGDPKRFILGIHLYAYEWNSDSSFIFLPNYSMNSGSDISAKAYTYSQVVNILNNNNGKRYEYESEDIFEYESEGIFKTMVYIDDQGIMDRINLAKEYHISGVVFWRLGGEGSLLSNLDI